uniref:Citrate transporter-like domain-containing protein n=1 Tax=Chaetoceros debilis TaxID=122233 RepID=A0A7S3QFA9_9STRA
MMSDLETNIDTLLVDQPRPQPQPAAVEYEYQHQQPRSRKQSFMRKWGPALVAIAGVIALNFALIGGPSFSNVPALNEKQLFARKLGAERTAAVEAMDFDFEKAKLDRKMGRNFGSRNLSESDGGIMEYTRRRHRVLGDYVHEDVSDQFTAFGKWTVSIIYFAFWVFLMFPNWFLPIGRPGIALGGGLTMVVYRFILYSFGHGPVFDAEKVIILEPLFLLFGLMLTTIYLEKMERGGLFDKLRNSLDDPVNWKRSWKIMLMSTIGSAAVMNDSVVLIFSGVVVDLCVRHKVANSMPYLLSLASTANIGSAFTMTGNPQNILIVSLAYDDISWTEFLMNMVLPVLGASLVNTIMVFLWYGQELFPGSSGIGEHLAILFTGRKTPEIIALENAHQAKLAQNPVEESGGWSIWSKLQVLIAAIFLSCFALGYDVCVVSISTGCVLMVVNAYKHQHYDPRDDLTEYDAEGNALPPKRMYDMDGNEIEPEEEELITESETTLTEVDYGLLLLFMGQFLLIGSFDDTGVPQAFFAFTMGDCADQMTSVPCVYWFVMIITILSNVASNVPVCQMLAATFPYATPYDWMQVSFSATIAGNLTMLGSAANMIVAFQAAKVGDRSFTSERHAPFGIPSTILSLYLGTFILTSIHFAPECSEKLGTCEDEYYQYDNAAEYYQYGDDAAAGENQYYEQEEDAQDYYN